jgi:NAD-reducing hydrogenase large subunit
MTAAGSPGHFPVTAVVGGVAAPADAAAIARCREALPDALVAALRLARETLAAATRPGLLDGESASTRSSAPDAGAQVRSADPFGGADVATVDDDGAPDLLGRSLRVVSADGRLLADGVKAAQWDGLVAEARPGDPAPRPYLRAFGPEGGRYRVGPVAQLRAGTLNTPFAADLQQQWWAAAAGVPGGGALGARAVMTVHCIEAISDALDRADPGDTQCRIPLPVPLPLEARVGTGWVDGARGLLVHRYEVTDQGRVRAAIVLTPTAQNEYWLAGLLRRALRDAPDGRMAGGAAAEDAIRDADPCLPCSAALPGTMGLTIETVPPGSLDAGGE